MSVGASVVGLSLWVPHVSQFSSTNPIFREGSRPITTQWMLPTETPFVLTDLPAARALQSGLNAFNGRGGV